MSAALPATAAPIGSEMTAEACEVLARAHGITVLRAQFARYAADTRCRFDADAARTACAWIERHLRHSKGAKARQSFILEPWEAMLVSMLFGWRWVASNRRVIRQLYLFVARKNGKSTLAAALALYLLLEDAGNGGPEVIGAAADVEQAGIVFREASAMLAQAPALRERTESLKRAIVAGGVMGSYKVISSMAERQHGLNPSAVIFDELHTQPNRDLYDVLHTAIGAREQPLEVYMTTAGYDRRSICWELHQYALQVRDGALADLTILPVIFGADDSDDWRDPATWAKANPSMGAAIGFDYLEREAIKAGDTPGYQNVFRRLHLNQWTEQSSRWLDMEAWRASAGSIAWPDLPGELAGRRCYGGLDLAKVRDFSAWALLFPPSDDDLDWKLIVRFWLPNADLRARAKRDRVPYRQWIADGLLQVTEGNCTDFRFIQAAILEDAKRFQILGIGFDRTFAGEIVQNLGDEGLEMIEVGQGFYSLAAPTAEFERLVLTGTLQHGSNPVLAWMAGNVAVRQDPAGNLKPDKERSGDKIDGIAAAINALALHLRGEETTGALDEFLRRGILAA